MKLCIALACTSDYLYAWKSCVRRIVAAAGHRSDVHVVYVSNPDKESDAAYKFLKDEIPKEWVPEHRKIQLGKPGEPYKIATQLLIAKLHGEMFAAARAADADLCWTVEPDILVRPDSLRMMEWALQMPSANGTPIYDVAFCTYPNGLFIGGNGDPQNHIAQDFDTEERDIPPELKVRLAQVKADEKRFADTQTIPDEAWVKDARGLHEELMKCPPKHGGNIHRHNADRFRRRGWLNFAFPTVGWGGMVPSDWAGQGCNLLSRKALALSSFEGYNGEGTQDLFLCWMKYHPAGVKIACIPHSPCDHVKKQGDKDKQKLVHMIAYHEQNGEERGHLRVMEREWIEHS